jgi:4-amino-4-deoxy-L-arabinose transferase-like glycosyltransferase
MERWGVSLRKNLGNWKDIFVDFLYEEKREVDWRFIAGLLLLAFLLRLPLLIFPEVIHNDGTEYIRQATLILSEKWAGSKVPPFYPGLIALAHTFIQNYELAGIWVSVIFGTAIVLPIFYLGRSMFNESVGRISGLMACVHPFFTMSSGSVLTESVYYFLTAAAVLLGWVAFQKGRLTMAALLGLLTSMAYLTRPEAIGFLFVFSVWVLVIHPPGEKRRWKRKIGMILVAVVAFLAFSSPYLIQVRKDTGRWEISRKTSVSVGSLSGEEGAPSIETIKRQKGISLTSLLKNPGPVLERVGIGLLDSLYKFQQVYTPILFILAILGWVLLFKRKMVNSLTGSFYGMAYLVFYFGFVFPFFWITRRYTSQLIPIAIPWAGFGFLGLMDWVKERRPETKVRRDIPALLLILLVILFVQGRVIHSREQRFIQKETGLWMKGHLPRGVKVMSSMPQEAFYAELPWVIMPQGSYEEVLNAARSEGVRYIVIDEKVEEDSPGFLKKVKEEELKPVMEWKMKKRSMTVLELGPPGGK